MIFEVIGLVLACFGISIIYHSFELKQFVGIILWISGIVLVLSATVEREFERRKK